MRGLNNYKGVMTFFINYSKDQSDDIGKKFVGQMKKEGGAWNSSFTLCTYKICTIVIFHSYTFTIQLFNSAG